MIISITDDFNLYKIANCGQCFRGVEIKDGVYRFITKENVIYLKEAENNPKTSHTTKLDISATKSEWEKIWMPYFDMERSYKDVRALIKDDSYLENAANLGQGIRILRQDAFEMLITFIISQRKSIPAIRTSVERISKLHGKKLKTDYETIYAFPTAEKLANAKDLESCGLGYRLPYILEASKDVKSGLLDLDKLYSYDDEELFNALKEVKGVGDKVSNCICLFAFNRTARAPVDVWIKRVIDDQYNGINPFPKYGENAGIMQQYMFYAAKNQ
ncbi:MAG: DNA-3-methyladenine glycosylase 2 family protein [Lachnospiraceae bacterium]|nr:DNA-3-methyladenine glycosylase 2 family protein [Lachnospiraceae bacterium]